eukprot:751638-Pelagomonas_calceolata.AAC.1
MLLVYTAWSGASSWMWLCPVHVDKAAWMGSLDLPHAFVKGSCNLRAPSTDFHFTLEDWLWVAFADYLCPFGALPCGMSTKKLQGVLPYHLRPPSATEPFANLRVASPSQSSSFTFICSLFVAAMDHQGMGRSEGHRWYVHAFQHYVDDAGAFVTAVHDGVGVRAWTGGPCVCARARVLENLHFPCVLWGFLCQDEHSNTALKILP